MMNLGTYVGKQYESIGESRGIAIGESRGIAIGESRGTLSSAQKLYKRGFSYADIEDLLEVTEEELRNYMEQEQ